MLYLICLSFTWDFCIAVPIGLAHSLGRWILSNEDKVRGMLEDTLGALRVSSRECQLALGQRWFWRSCRFQLKGESGKGWWGARRGVCVCTSTMSVC